VVVFIQQCTSDYEGEKDEDYETFMSHEGGDHKGHKHEDHTAHNHRLIDDPKYDNPIFDIGFDGIRGVHDRKNLLLQKFRRGPTGYHQ